MTTTHAALHDHAPEATPGRAIAAPAEAAAARPAAPGGARPVDRRVWFIAGAIVAAGALLAAGVPVSTLLLLGAAGGCLGMHPFMGHGGHASHDGHAGGAEPDRDLAGPGANGSSAHR